MVTLLLVVGLVVMLFGCGWAVWHTTRATEPFATAPPPPPPYAPGVPVIVQWGNSFCFYQATVSRLPLDPKTNKPYTKVTAKTFDPTNMIIVHYTGHVGQETPNGKAVYEEEISASEAYNFPGNDRPRGLCRVFRVNEPGNPAHFKNAVTTSGVNSAQRQLYCNPVGYSTDYEQIQDATVQQLHKPTAAAARASSHSGTKDAHHKSQDASAAAPSADAPAKAPAPSRNKAAQEDSGSCNACAWTFTAVPFKPGTQPKSAVEKVTITPLKGGSGGGGSGGGGSGGGNDRPNPLAATVPMPRGMSTGALSAGATGAFAQMSGKFDSIRGQPGQPGQPGYPTSTAGLLQDKAFLGAKIDKSSGFQKFKAKTASTEQKIKKTKAYNQAHSAEAAQQSKLDKNAQFQKLQKQTAQLKGKASGITGKSVSGKVTGKVTSNANYQAAAQKTASAKKKATAKLYQAKQALTNEFFTNPPDPPVNTNTLATIENPLLLRLVNLLMVDLWKNTTIDTEISLEQPLNASPSITSDTYHTSTTGTDTAEFNDYMYYNTPNGCVPPDLAHISPQSTLLKTHPSACTGTMYRFKTPKRTELHMVGSDEGGSALLMFPQLVHTLKVDVQAVLGDSLSVVQDFAEAISLCMFEYIPMRKYATVDQLQKLLAEFYGAPPTTGAGAAANSTLIVFAVHKRLSTLNKSFQVKHPGQLRFTGVNSTILYKQLYNRMVPMLVTRANDSVSHDTTVTPATEGTPHTVCCEHDRVISVGIGNTDVAADMSIAAYQNAPFTRLIIGGEMTLSEGAMLGNNFRDTVHLDLASRDRCVLRLLVYLYLGVMTNNAMTALHRWASIKTGAATSTATAHAAAPPQNAWLSHTALQLIRQTGVQLLAVASSLPPATVATHPLMIQWAALETLGDDPARLPLAQQIIDALLPVSPPTPQLSPRTITDYTPVPKIVAHKTLLIPAFSVGPVYTTTVDLPWVTGVYGVHSAVEHAHALNHNVYTELVQTEPSRRACRVVVQRVGPDAAKGWDTPFRVVLSKRITVEQVTPTTFMHRIFLGYHTPYNIGNVYSALAHSPVYALSDNAINNIYPAFANGQVYRSTLRRDNAGEEQCFRVQCPPTMDRCCIGVSDVSLCGPQLLANAGEPMASCPRGVSVGQLKASGATCHDANYDTTHCQDPFHQLLANARNATLVLDEAAVPPFTEFLTHPGMTGVRLAMMAKLIKTLILTTSQFHDLAVAAQTLSADHMKDRSSPAFQSGVRLWTLLDHLFTVYEVVGIVAPPVMSDGGELLSNPANLRTTATMDVRVPCRACPTPECPDPAKATLDSRINHTVAFQAHKTLSLTFRRRLDNSASWRARPGLSLYQLQSFSNLFRDRVRLYQQNAALHTLIASKPHIAFAGLDYSPNMLQTVLAYSCPPAMSETLRGMLWFGRSFVGIDVDEKNPVSFGLLSTCPGPS